MDRIYTRQNLLAALVLALLILAWRVLSIEGEQVRANAAGSDQPTSRTALGRSSKQDGAGSAGIPLQYRQRLTAILPKDRLIAKVPKRSFDEQLRLVGLAQGYADLGMTDHARRQLSTLGSDYGEEIAEQRSAIMNQILDSEEDAARNGSLLDNLGDLTPFVGPAVEPVASGLISVREPLADAESSMLRQ